MDGCCMLQSCIVVEAPKNADVVTAHTGSQIFFKADVVNRQVAASGPPLVFD